MKNIISTFLTLLSFSLIQAQLKSPSEFLGYEIGSRFTRHHQVIEYVNHLAENSLYATTKAYGETYEGRTLQLVYLSSPKNLDQLEELRKDHLRSIGYENGDKTSEGEFSVVWLSYNVHGNESSSTEAALKTLHTLVTTKKEWLENLVVIIDPCVNPDGRDRYVNWYNQVKSTPFDSKPIANEHFEDWPGGRYNHYYTDLNRDWAWLYQVESQQRLPNYLAWMPQIHVDFHEQNVNSPYYFAPATEPYHEVITDFQREFQLTIGKNHASYFDREGWLYFTDEVFDLLYPGYGDTYPMFNGAIGMTYEQGGGGRAGLSIRNDTDAMLTLKDRIAHHYTTGLSTVEVAHQNVKQINAEFKAYHEKPKGKYATYAIEGPIDKLLSLKRLLDQHQVPTYGIAQKTTLKGIDYHSLKNKNNSIGRNALILNGKGKKGNLIQALIEPQTVFSDSLTYDITSWSLPYAYGLKAVASNQAVKTIPFNFEKRESTIDPDAYAYAAERKSFLDGKFLATLIAKGIRVNYNKIPLTNGGKRWDAGSLFILRGENKNIENLGEVISSIAQETQQEVTNLTSGFSEQGPDLGSDKMKLVVTKKIGLLKSENASPISYGELWHFFEQQLNFPITQLSDQRLNDYFLKKIDVLIIPHGYYDLFKNKEDNALIEWLKKGGRIVALGGALTAFEHNDLFDLKRKGNKDNAQEETAYAQQEREGIREEIYGSIYKAKVDPSHPLAFGYNEHYFTLKTGARAYEIIKNNGTAAHLPENVQPHAGYSGDKAITAQSNSLLFGVDYVGNGTVVYFVDNPLYRNFWENGKLWLINSLFF
ncbi:MAG: M14 family metallopeptidase [Flavobacteriaceae bacterium]